MRVRINNPKQVNIAAEGRQQVSLSKRKRKKASTEPPEKGVCQIMQELALAF